MGKIQSYEYSCGAAALQTASVLLNANTGERNKSEQLEKVIYYYTCKQGHAPNCYSLPSGILDACHYVSELGLKIDCIYIEGIVFPKMLLRAVEFQQELGLLQRAGVPIYKRPFRTHTLTGTTPKVELFLALMKQSRIPKFSEISQPSLHWLLARSWNVYIDPADGRTKNWMTNSKNLLNLGISIVISQGNETRFCTPNLIKGSFLPPPGESDIRDSILDPEDGIIKSNIPEDRQYLVPFFGAEEHSLLSRRPNFTQKYDAILRSWSEFSDIIYPIPVYFEHRWIDE